MATKAFSVRNYRAFASETAVELRPLTLFFGYNSAGKSALLRWLPFLRDSASTGGVSPLDLSSRAIRGAAFADILSKFTDRPALEFGLSDEAGHQLRYIVRDVSEQRRQVVELLQITTSSGESRALKWLAKPDSPRAYQLTFGTSELELDVEFSGLHPTTGGNPNRIVAQMGAQASAALAKWTNNTYWLQANRAIPKRKEVFTGAVGDIEPDGVGITQRLYMEDASGSGIIASISRWYQEATGFKFTLQKGGFLAAELFSFCLEAAGRPVELADTGEGMGQVLPILALLFLAEQGRLGTKPTLVFEHPELHLHSAAEPALAELMCRVAATHEVSIVAETHSESFLLALQLALIQGRLRPEDAVVYWVRQPDGQEASISQIVFDKDGRPSGGSWPPGVFNEKTEQARKVVLARKAQQGDAG